jgi:hypothetical protein
MKINSQFAIDAIGFDKYILEISQLQKDVNSGKFPPMNGYTRHQYFFVLDKIMWSQLTPEQQTSTLLIFAGNNSNLVLVDKVLDNDNFIIFRLWLDLLSGSYPFNQKLPSIDENS